MTSTNFPCPLAAVLLDAGGTLISERRGRATIYASAAHDAGLAVDEVQMGKLMKHTLGELPRSVDGAFRFSRGWFEVFIERIFVDRLGLARERLQAVRGTLFERFADPAEYRCTTGALELLEALSARGVTLGVLSNWSEALPGLLRDLGLTQHLDFVLVSAIEGAEKPERAFFERGLELAGAAPASVLHVGNDPELDVQGALSVGILPVLVGEAELAPGLESVTRVSTLEALARII